jgi:hypothetical protein
VGRGHSNQDCFKQGGQFKAHFNYQGDAQGCSAAAGPSNTKAPPILDDTADNVNNMLLEYTSEDMFGDYA